MVPYTIDRLGIHGRILAETTFARVRYPAIRFYLEEHKRLRDHTLFDLAIDKSVIPRTDVRLWMPFNSSCTRHPRSMPAALVVGYFVRSPE
jgi:hypothetical protein